MRRSRAGSTVAMYRLDVASGAGGSTAGDGSGGARGRAIRDGAGLPSRPVPRARRCPGRHATRATRAGRATRGHGGRGDDGRVLASRWSPSPLPRCARRLPRPVVQSPHPKAATRPARMEAGIPLGRQPPLLVGTSRRSGCALSHQESGSSTDVPQVLTEPSRRARVGDTEATPSPHWSAEGFGRPKGRGVRPEKFLRADQAGGTARARGGEHSITPSSVTTTSTSWSSGSAGTSSMTCRANPTPIRAVSVRRRARYRS